MFSSFNLTLNKTLYFKGQFNSNLLEEEIVIYCIILHKREEKNIIFTFFIIEKKLYFSCQKRSVFKDVELDLYISA